MGNPFVFTYYVLARGCIENDFTVNGPLSDHRFAGDYPVSRYRSSLKISTWNGCTLVCTALERRISIRRGCSGKRSLSSLLSVCKHFPRRKHLGKNDLVYALFRTCNFHAMARVSQVSPPAERRISQAENRETKTNGQARIESFAVERRLITPRGRGVQV